MTIAVSTGADPTLSVTQAGATTTLDFNTATQIIDSALQAVGLNPNEVAATGVDQGQTLTNYFWKQITGQGITDETTIGEMVSSLLPETGQFNVAFPGYQQALKNGYVRTVAEYVSAEEGITAVLLQSGYPRALITPAYVGSLIANGKSTNEVADEMTNVFDAALNSPAEVQNYFEQEYGAGNGITALATIFQNPEVDDATLKKMLAGAQIRGAAAAANLPISWGLSQRLADMGQTYATAQASFKQLQQQAGLFQQTVGERQSQRPVPGTLNANVPLTAQRQGVEAAFGLSAEAEQQVHQASLARQNEFRGGGGAATTEAEGYLGQGSAKPF